MDKIILSEKQKKLNIDLWIIIIIVSLIIFGIFIVFQEKIYGIVKNEELPILSRFLLVAFFQYGLAGFGFTIVSILRNLIPVFCQAKQIVNGHLIKVCQCNKDAVIDFFVIIRFIAGRVRF